MLVAGIYLLVRGHDISQSISGQLQTATNQITGRADGPAVQYYLGGAICCAVGLVALLFWPSKR